MKHKHLYIGLDVHKNENEVALAVDGRNVQVLPYGRISNDLHAIDRLITKLRKNHPKMKRYAICAALEPTQGRICRHLVSGLRPFCSETATSIH